MDTTTLVNYREKYLDLLEETVTFSLWSEPLRTVDYFSDHTDWRWKGAWLVDRFLNKLTGGTARLGINWPINREVGLAWPMLAHTMVGKKRLRNVRYLCDTVEVDGVPGGFCECGVWRGGCSIYARACLPTERKVIVCDSFQGLPYDPSEPDWCIYDALRVPLEEVQENFSKYGLMTNVEFKAGWFKDTLPEIREPIAILRCDGDMYSSTMQILGNLYPQVSRGGYVIIDDWSIENCRRAVEHYRQLEKDKSPIIDIDGVSVYWRKE